MTPRSTTALAALFCVTVAGAPGLATAQSMSLPATHGNGELRVGFVPDPHLVAVRAGGPIDVDDTSLPDRCAGYISDAPTYELKYTAGSSPLILRTVSDADTSLIVNGPDGQWHCDDDGGDGLNAELRFDAPKSGTYDIWVGSLGSQTAARLEVTERSSSGSGGSSDEDWDDEDWDTPASNTIDIRVCNESGRGAFAAVSYIPIGQTEFWVQGWFSINNGECANIAETENSIYYVFAETMDGPDQYWGGDAPLCVVRPGPFFRVHVGGECAYGDGLGQFTRREASGPGESVWTLGR